MKKQSISNEEFEAIMKKATPSIKTQRDFTDRTMERVRVMPAKQPFIKRRSTWAIFATAPVALTLIVLVASHNFVGTPREAEDTPTAPQSQNTAPENTTTTDSAADEAQATIDDINADLNALSDDEYSDSTLSDSALY